MNHRVLSRLLLCGLLATGLPALAATAAPAAEKAIEFHVLPLPNSQQQLDQQMRIEMRMKITPKADATDAEREKIATTMAAMPSPMVMSTRSSQRITTSTADKQGRIKVSSEIQMGATEIQAGEKGEIRRMPAQVGKMGFSAVLNNGRYEQIQFGPEMSKALPPEQAEALFSKLFNAMGQLEGAKLKVGEFIDVPFPLDLPIPGAPANAMNGKVFGRYTLTKVDKGVAEFDVQMQVNMQFEAPAAAASAASAPVMPGFTSQGSGGGKFKLRLADRLQLSSAMDLDMQMQVRMPDGNLMDMSMKMDMQVQGRSLAKAR
ncbi:hypothetical protein [Pelomonas sp. SE-A7]|uniref:hypothetical protein n=1 Tax=Pelomonas sp. SE-A7 TaxID=3054953 RepID=UPI00259C9989|nr:hypothetical protein [Pelomonas sp. SE-A7]MDM4767480.1 hypothetical protein [Pelomonas sp. SE-A7]